MKFFVKKFLEKTNDENYENVERRAFIEREEKFPTDIPNCYFNGRIVFLTAEKHRRNKCIWCAREERYSTSRREEITFNLNAKYIRI